jgi:hypothetical protein
VFDEDFVKAAKARAALCHTRSCDNSLIVAFSNLVVFIYVLHVAKSA